MSAITVSVFMLTYNQEYFIANAIESILMQETDFKYQLVIGEDYSLDSTREICERYAKQHPEKVKLLPILNKNIGLIKNYFRTIQECNGKYIAICYGDDYWVDKLKLQKQVDFLERNLDYSIVGSNYTRLYKDNRMVECKKYTSQSVFEFDDLVFKNLVPSVTALFRNVPKSDPLPKWILNFPYGDWPTYLWVLKNGGKIHYLEDITAVYRMDIGVSAQIRKIISDIELINLNILYCLELDERFIHKRTLITESILKTRTSLMSAYNREKKYLKGIKLFFEIFAKQKNKFVLIKFYIYSLFKSMKLP